MGDWSDDEKSTPKNTQAPTSSNDDWGDSQKTSNSYDNDNNDQGMRGGGRGRGGRGRGRGRGGNNNYENSGGGDREWKPRNRDENSGGDREWKPRNRDENGGGNSEWKSRRNEDGGDRPPRRNRDENNEGGDRPPRRNRDDENGGDRPPRRNRDENNEGGEEKKPEIYVPPEPSDDVDVMFGTAISAGINFDQFDKIDVKVSGNGNENFPPIKDFNSCGLRDFLVENITRSGYSKPTPIQKRAIPIIMGKRDLMGCAQTGSGKTAAYVLPIIETIMKDNDDMSPGRPQCLIVAPTRELVIQIFEEARKFAFGSWLKVCLAYGGASSRYQSERLTAGCHILVASPGRLMDYVNKTIITFENLKFLVLDEADRMLDMGFRDTIDKICTHETLTKENITTLMFSATFPDAIQHLASQYLRDYLFLTVGVVGGASTDVEQEFIEVGKFKKREKLNEILNQYCANSEEDRILVFVEAKRTADFLASFLSDTKISSTSIHGDRQQSERETALREFRKGVRKVLIATSVAARGLDIKGVTHVINYDLPKDIDEYVHRIGRTGRVGNRGKATSFFDPENDGALSAGLVQILTQAGQPVPAFLGEEGSYIGGGDKFGGIDVRNPIAAGAPQQKDDEDW